jgi:hypothetical protein
VLRLAGDIDWGNAPSWVAATTALVVGTFTILNVRTARRAYVDGKWDKKVHQARLVWAERQGRYHLANKGQPVEQDFGGMPTNDVVLTDVGFIELRDDTHVPADGTQIPVWRIDALRFLVKVSNNSSEPIGNVNVSVHVKDTVLIEGARGRIFDVIPPETSRMVEVHLAAYRHDAEDFRLVLTFTDSAGHCWTRTETNPPKERDRGS